MHLNKVPAVPVLNQKGQLVGSISHSTFRRLLAIHFERIDSPALKFHEEFKLCEDLHSCTVDLLVVDAIEKMLKTGYHHVWLVGEKLEINGVLTFTDVLKLFK